MTSSLSRALKLTKNIQSAPALAHLLPSTSSRPSLPPLTTSQLSSYNQKVASLQEATRSGNLEHISSILTELRDKQQLEHLSQPIIENVAAVVSSQCSPATSTLDSRILQLAEICAVYGAPAGLSAWMNWLISKGRAKKALSLYKHLAAVEVKGIASDDSSVRESAGGATTPLRGRTHPKDANVDLLLTTIAACAQLHQFLEAVVIASSSPVKLSREAVDSFIVNSLNHDDVLRERFLEYIHDLQTARLVARPDSLARHIQKLAQDNNATSLYNQWLKIKEGFEGSRKWLSASPGDDQQLLVMPEIGWAGFLSAFLRLSCKENAAEVWQFMIANSVPITEKIWNALLDGYCRLGSVPDAFAVWKEMQAAGCEPDLRSYASLLSILCKSRNSKNTARAEYLFDALFQHPVHDRAELIYHCNIMLDGYIQDKRVGEALKLLEKMRAKGPAPDLVSHNTLLRHYQKCGNLGGLANGIRTLVIDGLQPDVVTFTTLISALYHVSKDNMAQKVQESMEALGIPANTTTMTAAVNSLTTKGDPESIAAASDLLMKMESSEQQSVHPNEFTYLHVIAAVLRSRDIGDSEAEPTLLELQTRMRRRKVHMSRTSYESLMRISLSCGRPSAADHTIKYFREQRRQGLPLTPNMWQILLTGMIQLKRLNYAQELVREMDALHFLPRGPLAENIAQLRRVLAKQT